MSGWFSRMPAAAVIDKNLSAGAKVVLAVLGIYVDKHGCAWPSVRTIAAHAGISVQMVRRHMRALEAAGYVITAPSYRPTKGGQGRNRYYLQFPPVSIALDGDNEAEGIDPTGEEPTLVSGAPGAIERGRNPEFPPPVDNPASEGAPPKLEVTPGETTSNEPGETPGFANTSHLYIPLVNSPMAARGRAREDAAALDDGEEQQWRLDDPELDREWKGQASEPDPDDPDSWFPNGWGKRVPEPDATEPAETPQVARQGNGDDAGAETPSAPPVDPHGGLTGMARRFSERFLAAQGDIEAGKRVMAEYCAWMDAGEPEDWQEWSADGPAPTDRPQEPERQPGTVVALRPAPRRTPKREFATELREARERSGVTAFVLGQLTGLGEQGITNIEQGRATVTKMMRERIVAALIEAREGAMNGRTSHV